MKNDFLTEYQSLKRKEFSPIIGEEKLIRYLDRFLVIGDKRKFLEYLLNQVGDTVLIHPDSTDEACFLSSFRNPNEVQYLFTVSIPKIQKQLVPNKKRKTRKEEFFKFKLKPKYAEIDNFINLFTKVLVQYEVIDFRETSIDMAISMFTCDNTYQFKDKIKFGIGPTKLGFVLNIVFPRYFESFVISDLENSKTFLNFKGVPLKAQDLYKGVNTTKNLSHKIVDDIFSSIKKEIGEIG